MDWLLLHYNFDGISIEACGNSISMSKQWRDGLSNMNMAYRLLTVNDGHVVIDNLMIYACSPNFFDDLTRSLSPIIDDHLNKLKQADEQWHEYHPWSHC
jgi:hypothetical protein